MFIKKFLRYVVQRNRRFITWPIVKLSYPLYHICEHVGYDMRLNGEIWLLNVLQSKVKHGIIFDVGANVGDWSSLVHSKFESPKLHAFELDSETFSSLSKLTFPIALNNVGLGSENKSVNYFYSSKANGSTSIVNSSGESYVEKKGQIITGDEYCREKKIEKINLLKIDVEGYEGEVLKGFSNMLTSKSIDVIQFEYGFINIYSKFLLRDFYELLTKHGYLIGKLYPNYVDFCDYSQFSENFFGPNYVAVLSSKKEIIDVLKK